MVMWFLKRRNLQNGFARVWRHSGGRLCKVLIINQIIDTYIRFGHARAVVIRFLRRIFDDSRRDHVGERRRVHD